MELYIEPVNNSKRDNQGRFMPGHKSWNKGLRKKGMSFSDTQFKPGNKPRNTKPDWHVSLRREKKSGITYKHIKVPGRGYVLMHRWVWEVEHGEIPAGYIVRFKDGDPMNCYRENLELVTRGEHMQRNQNREKAVETMKELYKRERIRKLLDLKPLTKLGNGGRKKRNTAPAMG